MKNTKSKVIFFGTPGICIPFLELLVQHFNIPLIITQPDSVGGRNLKSVIIPAAKTFAMEHGIETLQPEILSDDSLVEKISRLEPFIGVAISYGKMIPGRIFRLPVLGCVNVHFSLLPYYRGAAPVQRAIENGECRTGITIFDIVRKMDAGDTWAQKEIDTLPDDTTETLWKRMSREGAPFLIDTLMNIKEGKISRLPQDHEKATYAPTVRKEEGAVDWNLTAGKIFNKLRAFTPWPGIYFCCQGKSFKVTEARVSPLSHQQQPGMVLSRDKQSLRVCCGNGSVLEIFQLQPPGKKPMSPYCYCMGNELPKCLGASGGQGLF